MSDLNIEAATRCLTALGTRWRNDWSDFDGRTLRSQLDEISAILHENHPVEIKTRTDAFVQDQEAASEW